MPLKADSLNQDDVVIFMYIIISDPGERVLSGQNETIMSIQSERTRNVLSVRGQNLVANTQTITDNEKFLIYHGPNDIIGLKSKASGKFVGAHYSYRYALVTDRDEFGRQEMFKVIEIFKKLVDFTLLSGTGLQI